MQEFKRLPKNKRKSAPSFTVHLQYYPGDAMQLPTEILNSAYTTEQPLPLQQVVHVPLASAQSQVVRRRSSKAVRDTLPARQASVAANMFGTPDAARTMFAMMQMLTGNPSAGMQQGSGQSSGLQNLQIFGTRSSGSQGSQQHPNASSSPGLHQQQALQLPASTSAGTGHQAALPPALPSGQPSSSIGLANTSQPAQNPASQAHTFQMELPTDEPLANDLMGEVDKRPRPKRPHPRPRPRTRLSPKQRQKPLQRLPQRQRPKPRPRPKQRVRQSRIVSTIAL